MVVALGPGKFYGSSLPRPRIYTDVKLNDERVDPPTPVLDPLLSWAHEAHWSMGGLSFKRLRLQGRIEGNVTKLRAQREKHLKNRRKTSASPAENINPIGDSDGDSADEKDWSPSPPPAPIATKRTRFAALIDEEEVDLESKRAEKGKSGGGGDESGGRKRRRLVRKLGDDFNRVATEKSKGSPVKILPRDESETVAPRIRSRGEDGTDANKSNSKGKKSKGVSSSSSPGGGIRASPRLAKDQLRGVR